MAKLRIEDVQVGVVYASAARALYRNGSVVAARYDRKVIGFRQIRIAVRGGTILVGGVDWVARGSHGGFGGLPRRSTLKAFAAGAGQPVPE